MKSCPEHPIDLGSIIFPARDHESSLPDVDVPDKHQAFIQSGIRHFVSSIETCQKQQQKQNNYCASAQACFSNLVFRPGTK